jgi:dolichol-phosphate mannosyltransferase
MNDWEIVSDICNTDKKVIGLNLSRNFGQHYAINAGLSIGKGKWFVVMDGDLQDQPEEIPALLSRAKEGFDIVYARRTNRQDSYIKKLSSKIFYKTLAYLTNTQQDSEIANFGIYSKKVINAILSMNDYMRYFPTMVKWVGFRSDAITVNHAARDGKSGYSFKALINLSLNTILSFSDKPLRLTIKLGISISILSFASAIFTLYRSLSHQIMVSGYSSLIISIWFLSGIMITLIGVTGLYIGRIFDQVKNRPNFIISEKLNHNDDSKA